jgi:hypothetical protein
MARRKVVWSLRPKSRQNPRPSAAYIDRLVAELRAKFGARFWAKPGYEWDSSAYLWSGEGAVMPDGMDAFNYYGFEEDPHETVWVMGVHKALRKWTESKGLFWECNDPGTYHAYKTNATRRKARRNPVRWILAYGQNKWGRGKSITEALNAGYIRKSDPHALYATDAESIWVDDMGGLIWKPQGATVECIEIKRVKGWPKETVEEVNRRLSST